MDDFVAISPAGFLYKHNWPTYPSRGIGEGPATVIQAPSVGSRLFSGAGEFDLSATSVGIGSGTLTVQLTLPAVGNQAIAFLVNNAVSPSAWIGLAIDSLLRPYAIVMDANGTIVGESAPVGIAGQQGQYLIVQLSWSTTPTLALSVAGNATQYWSKYPSVAWAPFTPASLLVGSSVGALSSFDLSTGSIKFVELSSTPVSVPASQNLPTSNVIVAGAGSVAVAGKLGAAGVASIAGGSTLTATHS